MQNTFFERREREGFAKAAEENQNLVVSFLRLLRNLRGLCVQNGFFEARQHS
jgi:hypothetical protein